MNYTDETLTTKDGVRIKAYICKLPLYARDRPTILIFHVSFMRWKNFIKKNHLNFFL